MIGLILMALILVPLLAIMVASVLIPPRSYKIPAMFTGAFVLQIIAMIIGFIIIAFILGLVIPQN
jgi:hypothetical protein